MVQFTPSIKQVDSGIAAKGDLKRAQALAKEGRFDEALSEYEAVLKSDPASFQAHMGAGNIKLRQQRGDEAIVHYQAACRIDPLKPQPYIRLGRLYAVNKQFDKSLEQFKNVIRLDPKAPAGYVGAGQVLVLQSKYDEAIEALNTALRLNPRLIPARRRLAQAYAQQKHFSEAIAQLNAALRVDPQNTGTYIGLGRIYLTQKDYNSARGAFQEAINLNPEAPSPARMGLAECLIEEGKLRDASEVLSQMETPQKGAVRARYHQLWGDIYYNQGLFKESADEYQAAALVASEDGQLPNELAAQNIPTSNDDSRWKEIAKNLKVFMTAEIEKRRAIEFDDE